MVQKNGELCLVEMPSVVITVEAVIAGHSVPMLLLEMALTGQAKDWSSDVFYSNVFEIPFLIFFLQLSLKSTLNLGMQYFNAALGVWEPLIEPVEIRHGIVSEFVPWQLSCDVGLS